MLEACLICTQGGLVLYQHHASPSLAFSKSSLDNGVETSKQKTLEWCNQHIMPKYWDNSSENKQFHIVDGMTLVWADSRHKDMAYVAVAFYPDILFEGPRQYLQNWARKLLKATLIAYHAHHQATASPDTCRPDPSLFDKKFDIILQTSKGQQSDATASSKNNNIAAENNSNNANKDKSTQKKGKEKRNWHDGNAKVTPQAMAALDKSKADDTDDDAKQAAQARAVAEAQAAYLPTQQELQTSASNESNINDTNESLVDEEPSTLITDWWKHLTGQKVLSKADLQGPLDKMELHLTQHNVAASVATALCQGVRDQLVGKKLNSMYRVQTAVYQALEKTLNKMLASQVDLLRQVYTKRGDNTNFFTNVAKNSFNKSRRKDPFVIVVVGINGVGKSTSLAKLAYFFKTNKCNPLLVAGDTFRSGAVEQLQVHASCLEIPLFSQGYSKDPSAVAQAAVTHAREHAHDVVLIDTAGRMQNNQPLMKALQKLVLENSPDFIMLVCEALVGHDGLSQYALFKKATGKINGLLLTKFDTVSEKVGAALTMTYETGTPIVFCGTGQKYHHLQKLSVNHIVQNLLK